MSEQAKQTKQTNKISIKYLRHLLDEGHNFLAYDLALEALKDNPDNINWQLVTALCLLNNGAAIEARKYISEINLKVSETEQSYFKLFKLCLHGEIDFYDNNQKQISQGDGLIDSLKLACDIYYRLWEDSKSPAELKIALNFSLLSYAYDHSSLYGIQAIFLSWISNQKKLVGQLAHTIEEYCDVLIEHQSENCMDYFAAGLSALINQDKIKAKRAYASAKEILNGKYALLTAEKKRIQTLRESGLEFDSEIDELLESPAIIIFGGQPIDLPQQSETIFPDSIELAVKDAILEQIKNLQAKIGYSSAACGSDILFIEAMLEIDAEVNIILPFAEQDFLEARINYAGEKWQQRFKNVLKKAKTVTWSTTDPYLNDDELFRYNNFLITGKAMLRGERLGTSPYLLVVMDYLAANLAGSAADFMDHWPDIMQLRTIDLDEIRDQAEIIVDISISESDSEQKDADIQLMPRKIKAMLFADIVHYSKMDEAVLPSVFKFLHQVKLQLDQQCAIPDLVESWGDALYVAMSSTRDMADYAVKLFEILESIDYQLFGLTERPQLRIGLHTGPVYESVHPFTERKIIFGQHVSRAARIEPITIPGEIYTSEHFVAVLKAEENDARHQAQSMGEDFQTCYLPEYIGILPLPKNFGEQAVYHLCQEE